MSDKKPKSLVAKMAAAAASMTRVSKDGRNDFHRYDYVTHDDVSQMVRGPLFEAGVFLLVNQSEHSVEDTTSAKGRSQRIHTLKITVTFLDSDSDQRLEVSGYGQSVDNEDKGVGKALSSGLKAILLKTFLLASGDPEEDIEHPNHDQRRKTVPVAGQEFKAPSPPPKPPMFRDLPKDRQAKARAKFFAIAQELGDQPGQTVYDLAGHLLTTDQEKGRASLNASTVQQVAAAINFLTTKVEEAKRQAAAVGMKEQPKAKTPNIAEDNDWAELSPTDLKAALSRAVGEVDVKLMSVLADAQFKVSNNKTAILLEFESGMDWHLGEARKGAARLTDITGLEIVVTEKVKGK